MSGFGRPPGTITFSPTPPQRGSFPLDHDGECKHIIGDYLACLKREGGQNNPECRVMAKAYLACRMKHQLMAEDKWENLGLQGVGKEEKKEGEGEREESVLDKLRRENRELVEKRRREEMGK